jgi:transposase
MDHISPVSRQQYEFLSLDDCIDSDNPVRLVDAFVDKLDLSRLGFKTNKLNAEGRPSFESGLFLKIYIYGYLNGIRSTRKLERECARNLEMQWLCGRLKPNYHSIADFRKVNSMALRNTFKLFVLFLRDADLVGGDLIAIDGTKSRAHNSKKNNYNQKKVDRHLKYIEDKTNEYLKDLDRTDAGEKSSENIKGIQEKINKLKEKEIKYHQIASQLEQTGEPQVSTTDPDSRALLIHGQVVEVSYNTQAAVDEKHKLVVATQTINRNDRNAFSDVVKETQKNLGKKEFTALADKGYNNAREIDLAVKAGVNPIVAQQEIANSNEKGTTPDYMVTKFVYNNQEDTYTCPAGQTLKSTGTWHTKKRSNDFIFKFKKYRTPACKTCPVRHLCTARAEGREVERSEYGESTDLNTRNYIQHYDLYRKRQELNEHVFGTIKRVWGYYYTNLKGLKKVNGEMSLIMTVYNMKRTINILGFDKLMEKLRSWKPKYKKSWGYKQISNNLRAVIISFMPRMKFAT